MSMSAEPQRSAIPSSAAAAQRTSSAASTPAANDGSKRRANDDDASKAIAQEHPAASAMSDISNAVDSASAASPPAAAASFASSSDDSTSDPAARKKLKHAHTLAADSAASSAAAANPPFSRWATLYNDALHSIFNFASLVEWARLLSVSRRWGEAVLSMPPLSAVILHNHAKLSVSLGRCVRHREEQELEPHSTAQMQVVSVDLPSQDSAMPHRILSFIRVSLAAFQSHPFSIRLLLTSPAYAAPSRMPRTPTPDLVFSRSSSSLSPHQAMHL